MEQIKAVIKKMICISDEELDSFTSQFSVRKFNRQEIVCHSNIISDEIFFINRGLIRVLILDKEGFEQTIHFALENQFISDYSNFIQKQSSFYTLQAIEETEVVVLPRSSVDWGYQNLKEGDKMGRLIAEYYFIYQDNRIKNSFVRTPKQRYDCITEVFPNIHQRVPQHMIASYLGITPVHLSRLKK